MSKKTAHKPATTDLPKTPIEIGGKTYFMCFDMDALSDAEEYFNQRGANVNLLRSLSSLGLRSVRQVFPCALHTHHPELGFKEAQKLLTIQATYSVAEAIVGIWSPAAADPVSIPAEG
jgi:hypothetical protein